MLNKFVEEQNHLCGRKSGKNLWIQLIIPHSSKYKPTVTDPNRLTITNHVFVFKKNVLFGNIFLLIENVSWMVKFYICIRKRISGSNSYFKC